MADFELIDARAKALVVGTMIAIALSTVESAIAVTLMPSICMIGFACQW